MFFYCFIKLLCFKNTKWWLTRTNYRKPVSPYIIISSYWWMAIKKSIYSYVVITDSRKRYAGYRKTVFICNNNLITHFWKFIYNNSQNVNHFLVGYNEFSNIPNQCQIYFFIFFPESLNRQCPYQANTSLEWGRPYASL